LKPQPYNKIAEQAYDVIRNSGLSDKTLSQYFEGCFNDLWKDLDLYMCWICVSCLRLQRFSYGWGKKPRKCAVCGSPTYEVATFQSRASYVGRMFEWACTYLLKESVNIHSDHRSHKTKLYDFELKPDVVVEAKGSPSYILNPDGTTSLLGRAGLSRSDTRKKAFANARAWRRRFPRGHFYIITNSLPKELFAYRDDDITGVYDISRLNQFNDFVSDLRRHKPVASAQ